MKFIRVKLPSGLYSEINVSHVQAILYNPASNSTIFTLRYNQSIAAQGDWTNRFRKFLASGASWTDGDIYEYNR